MNTNSPNIEEQETVTTGKEKKPRKKHRILIVTIIIVITLFAIPVLVAGYFGFVPGLSTIMGATKAKDLGVTYTTEDYQSYIAKTQTTYKNFTDAPQNPEKPDKKTVFADPVTVTNLQVSQEEITAAINESEWAWMPIDNVQVRFTEGVVEISGNLQLDYITQFISFVGGVGYTQSDINSAVEWGKKLVNNAPIYIKANGSVSNNQLSLTVQNVQIGRYTVPNDIAQTVLQTGTQSAIANTPYLDAQSATLSNGNITFTGTHPSTIYVKTQ